MIEYCNLIIIAVLRSVIMDCASVERGTWLRGESQQRKKEIHTARLPQPLEGSLPGCVFASVSGNRFSREIWNPRKP